MIKNFFKFFFNYLPNLFFIYFALLIFLMVIIVILDTILGSKVAAAISNIIFPLIMYVGSFVVVASVIQWINNLIILHKADANKEVKSKWRYFMFLFFIFANADFYEAFDADKDAPLKDREKRRPSSEALDC